MILLISTPRSWNNDWIIKSVARSRRAARHVGKHVPALSSLTTPIKTKVKGLQRMNGWMTACWCQVHHTTYTDKRPLDMLPDARSHVTARTVDPEPPNSATNDPSVRRLGSCSRKTSKRNHDACRGQRLEIRSGRAQEFADARAWCPEPWSDITRCTATTSRVSTSQAPVSRTTPSPTRTATLFSYLFSFLFPFACFFPTPFVPFLRGLHAMPRC